MNYTKMPELKSIPTPEQLYEITNNDPVRLKLQAKIRSGEIKPCEALVYIDSGIEDDLKTNGSILIAMMNEGKSFCCIRRVYRDVIVKAIINKVKNTYSIIVTDEQGLKLNDGGNEYNINLDIHTGASEKEIQIKWVALDDKGAISLVAAYNGFFTKLSKKVKELKWKN